MGPKAAPDREGGTAGERIGVRPAVPGPAGRAAPEPPGWRARASGPRRAGVRAAGLGPAGARAASGRRPIGRSRSRPTRPGSDARVHGQRQRLDWQGTAAPRPSPARPSAKTAQREAASMCAGREATARSAGPAGFAPRYPSVRRSTTARPSCCARSATLLVCSPADSRTARPGRNGAGTGPGRPSEALRYYIPEPCQGG